MVFLKNLIMEHYNVLIGSVGSFLIGKFYDSIFNYFKKILYRIMGWEEPKPASPIDIEDIIKDGIKIDGSAKSIVFINKPIINMPQSANEPDTNTDTKKEDDK